MQRERPASKALFAQEHHGFIPIGTIYEITNIVTGDTYIGSTTSSIKRRWKRHREDKRNENSPLYREMMKHEPTSFRIEAIATCLLTDKSLIDLELTIISDRKPTYNVNNPVTGRPLTRKSALRTPGTSFHTKFEHPQAKSFREMHDIIRFVYYS